MPQLREIQEGFFNAVLEGEPQALVGAIAPRGSALRSLALYRRLIRGNYTRVLMVTYPVLYRFVGERYFGVLARGYVHSHPSTSGDLFAYGQHLPAFLKELQVSPLLAELARLDWACHEVYQAADSQPISREALQTIASADPSRVTIRVHAAARVVRFPFPVHRIWLALQPDAPANEVIDLPLPDEETRVLVTRGEGRVQVTPLAPLDGLLLAVMANGKTLAEVERMAVESQPEFDVSRFWISVLTLGLISGFSVEESL